MWKKLVQSIDSKCEFEEPADDSEIIDAEESLNLKFPKSLSECLSETNGILGEYGLGLIWPLQKIVTSNTEFRVNRDFRELYMPFDSLLFFGAAGNGDQFAFPIQAGKIRRDDVFVWNHEDDSRTWVAPNLEKFVEWFLDGRISV